MKQQNSTLPNGGSSPLRGSSEVAYGFESQLRKEKLIMLEPEIVGGILWLETYPGYRPRWVPVADMSDLEMILCDGCNFVVSEDEYLECSECGRNMCLYCYQSGEAEHGRRFSAKIT